MEFIPKGGMCKVCANCNRDCSRFDFELMPVIERAHDLVVVRCSEFWRKASPKRDAIADLIGRRTPVAISLSVRHLRQYRLNNDMTLPSMSQELGLTSAELSAIETEGEPVTDELKQEIERRYGVKM